MSTLLIPTFTSRIDLLAYAKQITNKLFEEGSDHQRLFQIKPAVYENCHPRFPAIYYNWEEEYTPFLEDYSKKKGFNNIEDFWRESLRLYALYTKNKGISGAISSLQQLE